MIQKFEIGATKTYTHIVSNADLATFTSGNVHEVYATFALARDAEWCCRLFVLEMKESHEEGIGTHLLVNHLSPALLGQEVLFTGKIVSINKNEIICSYVATVNERIIAEGTTGQKIIAKEKLNNLFKSLQ